MPENENGWNEWSRHVLKELERLNEQYENLREINEEIKNEIVKFDSIKDEIVQLKDWQSKVNDIASPLHLKILVKDVASLKTFQTKSVTIFATVQSLMVLAMAALKYFQ